MTDQPIVCTLSGGNYAERMQLTSRLGADALLERHSTSEQTRLRFRRDPQVLRDLQFVRDAEAACCAFLRLDLTEGDADIVLTIATTNPDGAFMVTELADAFAAHALAP